MTIPLKKDAVDPKKVANINKLSPKNMNINLKDLEKPVNQIGGMNVSPRGFKLTNTTNEKDNKSPREVESVKLTNKLVSTNKSPTNNSKIKLDAPQKPTNSSPRVEAKK